MPVPVPDHTSAATPGSDVPPPFRPWPKDAEVLAHTGGCHCRAFTYELEHPSLTARPPSSCNCSICSMKGEMFIYTPAARFRFTRGSFEEASHYSWGKHIVIRHFCPTCGSALLWTSPQLDLVGVNVRTFDGVDIAALKYSTYDGARLL
ncbi:hypothetical protein M0805_002083 [Coniferiporia weirii]|nr:hypothetical protein M0805_002083 [Coniferiporia weirii]